MEKILFRENLKEGSEAGKGGEGGRGGERAPKSVVLDEAWPWSDTWRQRWWGGGVGCGEWEALEY